MISEAYVEILNRIITMEVREVPLRQSSIRSSASTECSVTSYSIPTSTMQFTSTSSVRSSSQTAAASSSTKNDFLKWQVSTQSGLKISEEKLRSRREVAQRQGTLIAKLRIENDADVAEATAIVQENQILSGSLEDAKSEVIKFGNQVKMVKAEIIVQNDQIKTKKDFEKERNQIAEELTGKFEELSLKYERKIEEAQNNLNIKQETWNRKKHSLDESGNDLRKQFGKLHLNLDSLEQGLKVRWEELRIVEEETNCLKVVVAGLDDANKMLKFRQDEAVIELGKMEEKIGNNLKDLETCQKECLESTEEIEKEAERQAVAFDEITDDLEANNDEIADLETLTDMTEESLTKVSNLILDVDFKISEAQVVAESLIEKIITVDKTKSEFVLVQNLLEKTEIQQRQVTKKVETLAEVDTQKEELDEINLKLYKEIHNLESMVNQKIIDITEAKELLRTKDNAILDREEELERLSSEVNLASNKLEDSQRKETQLKSEESKVAATNKLSTQKVNDLKKMIVDLEAEIHDHSVATSRLDFDLAGSTSKKSQSEETNHLQEVKIDELKSAIGIKKGSISEVSEKMKSLDSNSSCQTSSLNDKELASKLKSVTEKLKKMEKELKFVSNETLNRSDEKKKLEKELSIAENSLNSRLEKVYTTEAENELMKAEVLKLEAMEEDLKKDKILLKENLDKIKKIEKEITVSKRALTAATKSHDKMSKQFEKSTKERDIIASEKAEKEAQLQEIKATKESLINELRELQSKCESLSKSMSNSQGGMNLKLAQNVLRKHEEQMTKMIADQKMKIQECQGFLICKERDNEECFKKLQGEVHNIRKELKFKRLQLDKKFLELKQIEEMKEDSSLSSKYLKDTEDLTASIAKLEAHYNERVEEEKKLEAQMESLKETDSPHPTPSSKFFKTPRTMSSYKSPVIPSPRKKLKTSGVSASVPATPSTPRR